MVADLVTVVIPVYRAEKYLAETLRSLEAQTYPHFEVVLVDDGSTDQSLAICQEFARRDDRFRIVRQENSGPSAARNNGVANARGEYLVFLDSDDIMASHALESMVQAMKDEQADLVLGMYARFFDHQDPFACESRCWLSDSGTRVMDRAEVVSLFGQPKTSLLAVAVWGKMYKTALVREHQVLFPTDISYEEDCCFNVQYYRHIRKAAALHTVVNYYRQRDTSISKVYNTRQYDFLLNGYNERKVLAAELQLPELSEQMDTVFFLVTVSMVKKAAHSTLSLVQLRNEYRRMLTRPEADRVIAKVGKPGSKATRIIAALWKRKQFTLLALVMRSWQTVKKLLRR